MKIYGGFVEHLDAIPAVISTAPSWNSDLAVAVLALIAASAYVRISREIAEEAAGE